MDAESIGNTIITRNEGAIIYDGVLLPSDLYSKRTYIANILELKSSLQELGYKVEVIDSGKEIAAYSYKPFDLTYLNTMKEIEIENDQVLNNQLLTQMFMPFVSLEMWSKTIGCEDEVYREDKNIKVKISRIDTYDYRVVISRYDYSESFEGTLFPKPGKQRLDDLISRNSRLVYCKIKQGIETLREGEYTLRGATIEKQTRYMYWRSIDALLEEEIYPDYILVPDISKYTSGLDKDYNYYKEYKTFLNIAKEHNLQVLIQNSDSKFKLEEVSTLPEEQSSNTVYKIGSRYYLNKEEISDQDFITLVTAGNDYIFNYSGDKENRLVYFFRNMTSYLKERPGYYIYLSGLLNNVFSATPDDIVYNSPVSYPYDLDQKVVKVDELPRIPRMDTIYILGKDYYLGSEKITDDKLIKAANEVSIKETLSSYKSNYLVYNNQMYYYRGYENGEDYETTAWMRFAIGKVYRELQKNKWSYLSLKNIGKIRENIASILSRILHSFSIIKSIDISIFKPVMSENRIELTLNVGVTDLVFAENNIVLDLIINYNKEN